MNPNFKFFIYFCEDFFDSIDEPDKSNEETCEAFIANYWSRYTRN